MQEHHHHYGSQVHLLNNPYLEGMLAKLCSVETKQPTINTIVEVLYNHLLIQVVNNEFKKDAYAIETRMKKVAQGTHIQPQQKVICVNLARAGTFPSHLCYTQLHQIIPADFLRQDHIFAARTVKKDDTVTGTEIGSSKIGGDKQDSYVIFPDPMGATGSTIVAALNHYQKSIPGKATRFVAIHLIVTPEYLKKVLAIESNLSIYALRLDRGLSPEAVLKSPYGQYWDQERGLNEKGYIIPGGGGFGEIMNNSFV